MRVGKPPVGVGVSRLDQPLVERRVLARNLQIRQQSPVVPAGLVLDQQDLDVLPAQDRLGERAGLRTVVHLPVRTAGDLWRVHAPKPHAGMGVPAVRNRQVDRVAVDDAGDAEDLPVISLVVVLPRDGSRRAARQHADGNRDDQCDQPPRPTAPEGGQDLPPPTPHAAVSSDLRGHGLLPQRAALLDATGPRDSRSRPARASTACPRRQSATGRRRTSRAAASPPPSTTAGDRGS